MRERNFDMVRWTFDDATGIGRLVLDRPDKLNALSKALRDDIVAGFEAFQSIDNEAEDLAVRVVIIEGAGDRAFSAGADFTEFSERSPRVFDDRTKVYRVCRRFPAPVIAKIDGYCLGGGLVLGVTSDFRLASDRSEFGLPEIEYDLVPGQGFMRQLAGLIGVSRAKELHMTGSRISAGRAETIGLVDHVQEADALEASVVSLAETIAGQSPAPIRVVKDLGNMVAGVDSETLYEDRTTEWLGGGSWY